MAVSKSVWGIDVGQCALKAMRCAPNGEGTLVVEAVEYIEYPKLLSQPEADVAELVGDAFKELLSRHTLRGHKVALGVSGQTGLARFIKLPPVESKKIPDIVKYEARQQIPFDLDDVIWDYQQLIGGSVEEGFALETEVGLFAMKREQVYQSLQPILGADIELDIVQLAPLALYNFATFEFLNNLAGKTSFDPENPPKSTVLLSLGTETTDLVVTNGFRVWQRSIPLGSSQFTKQLTKQFKLTFAKAEKLKRGAKRSKDAKKIFQAMRPIYSDLASELQRSVGYFQSIDSQATIGKIIVLGNGMKLPGLRQYLEKTLDIPVVKPSKFKQLVGDDVLGSDVFKTNLLAFPVVYGLCIQAAGQSQISTNLLPREISTERLVREKKPWAVATVAALMLACTINYAFHSRAWQSVAEGEYSEALTTIDGVANARSTFDSSQEEEQTRADVWKNLGETVVGVSDGRLLMAEFYAAINSVLPVQDSENPKLIPLREELEIKERNDLHISSIDMVYFEDLAADWFNAEVNRLYTSDLPAASAPDPNDFSNDEEGAGGVGPQGAGLVVEITGHHYYKNYDQSGGQRYIRNVLIAKLNEAKIKLPGPPNSTGAASQPIEFTLKEMGIGYSVLADNDQTTEIITNPDYKPPVTLQPGDQGYVRSETKLAEDGPKNQRTISVLREDFRVQFCWQPKTLSERLDARAKEAAAAAADNLATVGTDN